MKINQLKQKTSSFTKVTVLLFSLLLALGMVACDKEDVGPESRKTEVYMTDAPGNFAALNVEISKVEIYNKSEGWITLDNQTRSYNVITLTNGKQAMVASKTGLKAGVYTTLRFTFGANSNVVVWTAGGSTLNHSLSINSTTEVPINVELDNSTDASILIDFHAAESVVDVAGQYLFDPVITWVEDTETGVRGSINASVQAAVMLTVAGSSESVVASTYTDANGNFLIRGVNEGTYDLILQYRNATEQMEEVTFENVIIVDGEIRNMGQLSLN